MLAALLALGGAATAKSSVVTPYGYDDVWPAALRFLMLDEKCAVEERDAEAGFVLFQLTDDRKKWKGRLELVRTKDRKGRAATKLTILVEGRPDYTEQGLLDRLEKRLRDDLGRPEAAPPKSQPEPEPAPAPKGEGDGT